MAKLTRAKAKKICFKCGIVFEKPTKSSAKQWALRKYCSFQCRKLTKSEQDRKRELRRYQSLKDRGLCPWCHTPNNEEGVYHKRCSKSRHERYKDTNRNRSLVKLYGIDSDAYDALLISQNSTCSICGGTSGKRMLSVDHNHDTGVIRGLLCDNCNQGIGKFQDNPELLELAANYLRRHGKEIVQKKSS